MSHGSVNPKPLDTDEPVLSDNVASQNRSVPADPFLLASDLWKSYQRGWWPRRRSLPVLQGASLWLQSGEIVGLVGENGSGKSTLMKALVGDLSLDAGTVQQRASLGYCPQIPVLYERLSCAEHFDLFGAAYNLGVGQLASSRRLLYEELDFARFADTRVEELSGGTRSKLNLALALLHDPDVLLLDEPYAGFDWDTYQRFWDLTSVRRDQGATLLIISHFIADEERFDRIYDLVDGKSVMR